MIEALPTPRLADGANVKLSPARLKILFNLYPPYLGAGVSVDYISDDWRTCQVRMNLRWYNRNAVGTHFGGSLYSMVDPHLMLLTMNLMGKDYYVWDKSASISFDKATRKPLICHMHITDQDLAQIHAGTDTGDKYLHTFDLRIVEEESGDQVCAVKKVIYVRKKPPNRLAEA